MSDAFNRGRDSVRREMEAVWGIRTEADENPILRPRGNAANEAAVARSAHNLNEAIRRLSRIFDEEAASGYLGAILLGVCPYCAMKIADGAILPDAEDGPGWSSYCEDWTIAITHHSGVRSLAERERMEWALAKADDGLRWPILMNAR